MKKRTGNILLAIAAVSAVVFCVSVICTGNADEQAPVITCESPELEVTVSELQEGLLQGVSAYDDLDGDLTSEVEVAAHSMFVDKGVFRVYYTVSDSSGNMGVEDRLIRLTDYQSPRLTMKGAPVFAVGSEVSLGKILEVQDVLDGTLSDHAYLILTDSVNNDEEGEYAVPVELSNSYGDTVIDTVPVWIVPSGEGPEIRLSEYMVYLEKGSSFDAEAYIESVNAADGDRLEHDSVKIDDSSLDMGQTGTYLVKYTCEEDDAAGYAALAVVVTEKGQ